MMNIYTLKYSWYDETPREVFVMTDMFPSDFEELLLVILEHANMIDKPMYLPEFFDYIINALEEEGCYVGEKNVGYEYVVDDGVETKKFMIVRTEANISMSDISKDRLGAINEYSNKA